MSRIAIDLTNQTFGDLTVLQRAGSSSDKKALWLCKCTCGNTRIVLGKQLRSGAITNCGCKRKTTVKNILNQKFGKLTVIERKGSDNSNKALWLCQCECGNKTIVRGSDLISGKIVSCGCYKTEYLSNNLIGKKFGKLTVIDQIDKKNRQLVWRCKCECGNEINVTTNHLVTGNTQSCGCLKSKGESFIATWLKEHNIQYKQQFTFDDLRGRNNTFLRFDFAIIKDNKLNCLLEYQGIQHFQNVYNLTEEEWNYSILRDKLKKEYCNKNNIKLYIINYNDNINEKLGELFL